MSDNFNEVNMDRLITARNWQDKYRLILQWARIIKPKNDLRNDHHLVAGCEAKAWLAVEKVGNCYHFIFDSESLVIRGLAAVLFSRLDGAEIETIKKLDISSLMQTAGLQKHLTASRSNGFRTLYQRAVELAESQN